MKRTLTAAVLMLSLLMNSCIKKGDTGPAGPQGPAGTNGTNGTNGNANVKSGIGTAHPGNWTWDGNVYGNYVIFNDPDITQAIYDAGMVSVFLKATNGQWMALPYTDYPTPSTSFVYDYSFGVGQATIWLFVSDYSNTAPTNDNEFKIVAISASQKQANPNTNWNNYNEVMKVISTPAIR